jgi:serine/threonine protein kinase
MPDDAGLLSDPLLADVPVYEGYKVLGRVVLYEKLAQGGSGAVYKGRHLMLNADVAVKVIPSPAATSPEQAEELASKFVRGMRAVSGMKHENLLRVYDVDSESGLRYVVMPLVDGESAADRLRRKGRLSEQEAMEICRSAAEGLAAAHKRGIVHQNVKPDRIFVDKEGKVALAGLGLVEQPGEQPGERELAAPAEPDLEESHRPARMWTPRAPREDAATTPGATLARKKKRKLQEKRELDSFVRRYVRSLVHQPVLAHVARRGAGVVDPKDIAEALGMKEPDVCKVLDDWRGRGLLTEMATFPYYYAPAQHESELIETFLKDWTDPDEHRRLMAIILKVEDT